MWALQNETPYSADRTWVLDKDAAKSWVVVVRGTFDIMPDGTTVIAKKQDPPLFVPEYSGEPGTSSVIYEVDLTPSKPATDVILNGHAYARRGEAATEVEVTLRVSDTITKTLTVVGDRYWDMGVLRTLSFTSPRPFEAMPIIWERAFGGMDTKSSDAARHSFESRNPIGTGFAISKEHLNGQRLPNIEYPACRISSSNERPNPAGFGAVASYWEPRLGLAGTYDATWFDKRFPLLPKDFKQEHLCCAPADQQSTKLRGGEAIELLNLTPGGRLAFKLPRVYLSFRTRFGSKSIYHGGRLHTVILEPDCPRVIMVWHTSLLCQDEVDDLDSTLIFEKKHMGVNGFVGQDELLLRPRCP